MAKLNRNGQAKCWDAHTINKMRSLLSNPAQRLIFEISIWTGERMGAITQLRVEDIYDEKGRVKEYLTYQGENRKASRWGTAKMRIVKIHDELRFYLKNYTPPNNGYLFPSTSKSGHITRRGVDDYWRKRFKYLGLTGFSTHSSRRFVINQLAKTHDLHIIADTMGMNVLTVKHYLDRDDDACDLAIANLRVA